MFVQIVLFDGFDPLDVVAPFEVLAAGGDAAGGALAVELVAADGPREVVSGTKGLTLRATARLEPTGQATSWYRAPAGLPPVTRTRAW